LASLARDVLKVEIGGKTTRAFEEHLSGNKFFRVAKANSLPYETFATN